MSTIPTLTLKTRTLPIGDFSVLYSKMTDSVWSATQKTELSRLAGLDAVFPDVLKAYPKTTRKEDAIIIPVQLTKDETKNYTIKHRNDFENWLDGAITRDREMIINPHEELEKK